MATADREKWKQVVADFEASDLSQREFSAERGISFGTLRHWIYTLRREARPLVQDEAGTTDGLVEQAPTPRHLTLKPVRVVASAAKPRTGEALLELALPSGAVVRFPPGTDPSYLRTLAAAL